MRISVVGIGKLGLSMAVVLAGAGFDVIGVDTHRATVDSVNAGRSPIYEPGVQEMMTDNRRRLSATTSVEKAVLGSDATFVVVPTPSEKTGEFSLRYVIAAMAKIADALRLKKEYHLIVLTSTVLPGSIDGVVWPLIEDRSGKTLGQDFGLCYSPELIALGEVVDGLLNPDLVLIGESDQKAGGMLSAIKSKLSPSSPPMVRMNFVNAELAKIALNSFVTMKMSFANTLAEICEKLPGADVDMVTRAIGNDRRIGQKSLKGALGYGGPCFPRDNVAFAQFAKRIGAQAGLALATHKVNLRQPSRVVSLIESECGKSASVAVLGLAYKPKTNVLDASQGVLIAVELRKKGHHVRAYDPVATGGHLERLLGPGVHLSNSIESCLAGADVCVVATPWQEFRHIDTDLFRGKTVFDCWGIIPRKVETVAKCFVIGHGRSSPSSSYKQLEREIPLPGRTRSRPLHE